MSIIQEHVCLSILPFSITPFICQSYYCGNKDNVFLRPIITYSVFQIVNSFAVLLRQNFLNCLLRICCAPIVFHCNNDDYQFIIIYSKSILLNYEVKKRVFGFDETKTEKYVAQMKTLGVVGFKDLCDEVSKIGMAPRGVVKLVLDGLIDTLNMNINKGFSVQLGEFGCFRPGINAKSQEKQEDVTASTIYRRKIIFTPGFYFKDMLTRASVEKMSWPGNGTVSGGSSNPNPDGGGSDGNQGENPLG